MIELTVNLIKEIYTHLEGTYPDEGAGVLFGTAQESSKRIQAFLPLQNIREDGARYHRFLISPQDFLKAEIEAAKQGLDVVGIYHSHPDSPNQPSEYDRTWALPWFSYLIVRVQNGQAISTRSWILSEDRTAFYEEEVLLAEEKIEGRPIAQDVSRE